MKSILTTAIGLGLCFSGLGIHADDHKGGWFIQFSCKGNEGRVKLEGVFPQLNPNATTGLLSLIVEEDNKSQLINFTEASPIQLGINGPEVKGKTPQKALMMASQPQSMVRGAMGISKLILQSTDWAYRENNSNQLNEKFHLDLLLELVTVGPSAAQGISAADFPQTTLSSKQEKKTTLDCNYKAN